ncbi:MAG: vitamin B12 dependent methionine synthase [Deltaproteobacteria bacterium]|nr:vitamin B12 dependent methionine synthase [Deltaproteobacteria bacterium]
MDGIVLDTLEFAPDRDAMIEKMHLKEGRPETERFREMALEAQKASAPKAFYKISRIRSRLPESVVVDDQELESRILSVNTENLHRTFPFVVTCGTELTRWADTFTDMLDKLFADELKMAALRSAMRQLQEDIKARYHTGELSQMNPGSLEDWSIYEQKKLFALLGNGASRVGVELLSSMVMYPDKSESGIFFEKEKKFVNCRLCPTEKCPSRQAAYDSGLYDREYRSIEP